MRVRWLASALICLALPQGATTGEMKAISGYHFLSADSKALQDDDFANPGMLWVEHGETLWKQAPGAGIQSCQACHGDAETKMRTAATSYPKFDKTAGKVINLEGRINLCRTKYQHAAPFAYESEDLLGLTAYLAHQAKGLKMSVSISGPAAADFARGKEFFYQRRGQLNLACANCHEQNWGKHLRGEVISQGQINGFPIYRQLWQTMGSTHRMFAWCNEAVRAEPYKPGSQEYVDLELYLRWRGRDLPVETPGIRR